MYRNITNTANSKYSLLTTVNMDGYKASLALFVLAIVQERHETCVFRYVATYFFHFLT